MPPNAPTPTPRAWALPTPSASASTAAAMVARRLMVATSLENLEPGGIAARTSLHSDSLDHPHRDDIRGTVAREQIGNALERGRQVMPGALDGTIDYHQQIARFRRNGGVCRIRGRRPERPVVVRDQQPAAKMHALLADTGIPFARTAEPDLQLAPETIAVVEPERQLVLQRAEVADVHQRVDTRHAAALQYASQQRLAAWARLRGIEVEAVEQCAGLGHAGNVHGGLAGIQRGETRRRLVALLVEGGRQRLL